MRVVAVMVVRNEADIIATNLRYHHAAGVDETLVIDNGSSDGTTAVLGQVARTLAVRWTVDAGPYEQSRMTTDLSREAAAKGATWILPTDADEFWWSHHGLRPALATDCVAVRAPVVNFVQRRAQRRRTARALLGMTLRVGETIGSPEQAEHLVREGRASFIETPYGPKWAVRASESLVVHKGNHEVSGIEGLRTDVSSLRILHAPLRARETLRHMADHGCRLAAAGAPREEGWHARRWAELAGTRALSTEWAANSARWGTLDVHGQRRPLVRDDRLARAVAPFIGDHR